MIDVALSALVPESATATASSTTALNGVAIAGQRAHLVKVGAGGFQFEPAQLSNVSVGDVVTFEFYPTDHSVARAEYGSACVPYEYTGAGKVGFWSDTQRVNSVSNITHWNLTINNTAPIFYYCAAPNSCMGRLMVGVINSNSSQTIDGQIRAARAASFQLAPGESLPGEASSTLSGKLDSDHSRAKLPEGAIVGITLSGILFMTVCIGLALLAVRRRSTLMARGEATSAHLQTGYTQSLASPVTSSSNPLSPLSPTMSPPGMYNHPLQSRAHLPMGTQIIELEAIECRTRR